MINTKPVGPAVRVLMFYGTQQVYELNGTDDDRELEGKSESQIASALAEAIVQMETKKVRSVKREAA